MKKTIEQYTLLTTEGIQINVEFYDEDGVKVLAHPEHHHCLTCGINFNETDSVAGHRIYETEGLKDALNDRQHFPTEDELVVICPHCLDEMSLI